MQGFQKVVGHQEIITHLQNAISMNKVSHAYLFGGESGSGKKMMASLFAMSSPVWNARPVKRHRARIIRISFM